MASQMIKARDLAAGTAVRFYDGHWHRATTFEWEKGRKKLRVYDSRGWSNVFAKDQDVEVDYSL